MGLLNSRGGASQVTFISDENVQVVNSEEELLKEIESFFAMENNK